jgi:hypothetical protein
MKIRHIQVIGEIAQPLPDHKASQATHQLNLTNDKYDTYVNSTYFKVVEGAPVVKTQEEIDAQIAESDYRNAKQELREERDEKLNISTVTYDGAEFQTRPSDLINFTTMLTLLQNDTDSIVWTLADDSEKTITKADLQAVYLLGLQAGALIDKDYRDAVRAL